jgi:hypothetical protein
VNGQVCHSGQLDAIEIKGNRIYACGKFDLLAIEDRDGQNLLPDVPWWGGRPQTE